MRGVTRNFLARVVLFLSCLARCAGDFWLLFLQENKRATIMIIPKKARLLVYSYLFKGWFFFPPSFLQKQPNTFLFVFFFFLEGVIVVKKDPHAPKHHDIDVPNLYVMKLTQSFASRGYVQERFNWGWFYYYLTNEGIVYLREYLHLPEEIVPATLKKGRTAPRSGDRAEPRSDAGRGGFRGDRPESSRRELAAGSRDKLPADAGFAPEFVRV